MKKRNYSVIHPTLQPVKKDSKTANENVNRKHTAKHCDAYASEKKTWSQRPAREREAPGAPRRLPSDTVRFLSI